MAISTSTTLIPSATRLMGKDTLCALSSQPAYEDDHPAKTGGTPRRSHDGGIGGHLSKAHHGVRDTFSF